MFTGWPRSPLVTRHSNYNMANLPFRLLQDQQLSVMISDCAGEDDSSCDVSSTTNITSTPSSQVVSQPSTSNKKQINRGRWTKEEDEKLKDICQTFGDNNWSLIAAQFADRSDVQCQQRWDKVVNPSLVKGPWTKEVCCVTFIVKFYLSYDNRKTKK